MAEEAGYKRRRDGETRNGEGNGGSLQFATINM